MQHSQRTWLITGVTSGLGRHLVEQLLARGDQVAGTSRRPDLLADLQLQYGERLWLAELDLTDATAIRQVTADAFRAFGDVDVVVSNAGYSVIGAAEELEDRDIANLISTNLIGPMQLVRAALPHLRMQGGGRIMAVSSGAGQMGVPGLSLYCASKWALEGFFESLAAEVAPFGISTTLVEPGAMKTPFGSNSIRSVALPPYSESAASDMRRAAKEGYDAPVDPAKCARLIIESLDTVPAPLRLVLGSDSYGYIRHALAARLAQVDADREFAQLADFAATRD